MKAFGEAVPGGKCVFLWQASLYRFVGALGVGLGLLVLEHRMQIQGFFAEIGS